MEGISIIVACEQALWGALAAGREKEGDLATKYPHGKSQCQMLIGRDDISNDVITLGSCFSMFVYIRARFHFVLIGRNLKAQSMGSHRGNGGGIQIPETYLQALFPFPAPPPEHPEELARRLELLYKVELGLFFKLDFRHSLKLKM